MPPTVVRLRSLHVVWCRWNLDAMEMFLSGIQGLGLKAVTVSRLWALAHPDLPTGAAPEDLPTRMCTDEQPS